VCRVARVSGRGCGGGRLFDAGFDVWLCNNRGNKYSCKHVNLAPSSERFWNFSMDEMARYDIPAVVQVRHSVWAARGAAAAFLLWGVRVSVARRARPP
jgi:hypothetical protein